MRKSFLFLLLLAALLTPARGDRRGWLTVYNDSQQSVEVTVSGHCTRRLDPCSNQTFELPMGDYQLTGISRDGKRVYSSCSLSDTNPYTQWNITDWELSR